jgi:hypothetical protein
VAGEAPAPKLAPGESGASPPAPTDLAGLNAKAFDDEDETPGAPASDLQGATLKAMAAFDDEDEAPAPAPASAAAPASDLQGATLKAMQVFDEEDDAAPSPPSAP